MWKRPLEKRGLHVFSYLIEKAPVLHGKSSVKNKLYEITAFFTDFVMKAGAFRLEISSIASVFLKD